MTKNVIYVSHDYNASEIRNNYFCEVYYSKKYTDLKFDRAIELLSGIGSSMISHRNWDILCNVIDFLSETDENE